MVMNDILFRTQLNYQIETNNDKEQDVPLSMDDLRDIDLHRCRFTEFQKAISYIRDNNNDLLFSDSSIDAIKPADFSDDKIYNFIELIEFARHTAITIGNMGLFSELQKISTAADKFTYQSRQTVAKKTEPVLSFQDYDNYEIKNANYALTSEEIGSYVISGGMDEAIRVTAYFHDSSTPVCPIILVRFFSLSTSTYLPNEDIINLDTIFKPNASIIETFAYLSYQDYMKNTFNQTFDKLMFGGAIDVNTLDDMYSKHYDLTLYDHLN